MSGPKSYSYDVDYETEEQIRERLRREQEKRELEAIKSKYTDLLSSISGVNSRIRNIVTKIREIENETGKDIHLHLPIREFCDDTITYIDKNKDKGFRNINEANKALSNAFERHKSLEIKLVEINNILADCVNTVVSDMDSKMNVTNMKFDFLQEDKVENPYPDMIEAKLNETETLILSKKLIQRQSSIKELIKKFNTVDEYKSAYSLWVIPLVKECIEYNRIFSELVLRYEILTDELNIDKVSFKYHDNPIEELKKEIDKLEREILEKKKQEYISDSIEDVMLEMGYSLVGTRDVVKKSGKEFKNKLYKFSEGTVVNVTIQNNGQISMELGGVDTVDRSTTQEEAKKLVTDMQKFCDDNKKIHKLMKSKGINVKNISHLPPTVEYAQIINVEKYNLKEKLSVFTLNKSEKKKAKKELKTFKEN